MLAAVNLLLAVPAPGRAALPTCRPDPAYACDPRLRQRHQCLLLPPRRRRARKTPVRLPQGASVLRQGRVVIPERLLAAADGVQPLHQGRQVRAVRRLLRGADAQDHVGPDRRAGPRAAARGGGRRSSAAARRASSAAASSSCARAAAARRPPTRAPSPRAPPTASSSPASASAATSRRRTACRRRTSTTTPCASEPRGPRSVCVRVEPNDYK